MDRDPASILDIVAACRRLRRFVGGRTREDLDRDDLLLYAILHAIALIGEAANRLGAIKPGLQTTAPPRASLQSRLQAARIPIPTDSVSTHHDRGTCSGR
jgi:Ribonuclease HepT-like